MGNSRDNMYRSCLNKLSLPNLMEGVLNKNVIVYKLPRKDNLITGRSALQQFSVNSKIHLGCILVNNFNWVANLQKNFLIDVRAIAHGQPILQNCIRYNIFFSTRSVSGKFKLRRRYAL